MSKKVVTGSELITFCNRAGITAPPAGWRSNQGVTASQAKSYKCYSGSKPDNQLVVQDDISSTKNYLDFYVTSGLNIPLDYPGTIPPGPKLLPSSTTFQISKVGTTKLYLAYGAYKKTIPFSGSESISIDTRVPTIYLGDRMWPASVYSKNSTNGYTVLSLSLSMSDIIDLTDISAQMPGDTLRTPVCSVKGGGTPPILPKSLRISVSGTWDSSWTLSGNSGMDVSGGGFISFGGENISTNAPVRTTEFTTPLKLNVVLQVLTTSGTGYPTSAQYSVNLGTSKPLALAGPGYLNSIISIPDSELRDGPNDLSIYFH